MKKNTTDGKDLTIPTSGTEIVKDIMKKQGVSLASLAESTDYNSSQAVFQRLKGDDIKLSTLLRFLDALNYRIVIEPNVGSVSNGKYLVEHAQPKAGDSK